MGFEKRIEKGESGLAALELMLSLPILALVFVGIAAMVTSAARNYMAQRVQAEVQQEVQQAFMRVVDDCMAATSLRSERDGQYIRLYDGDRLVKLYFVNEDSRRVRKLVENLANFPMTGNHEWAMVEVTSFGAEEVDPLSRPGLYRIWLEAKSTTAGSVPYGLATEIYLPPQGGHP